MDPLCAMDYYPTLQGMCEVVMNEGDENDAYEEASEFSLPPVPTFDLQTDQIHYLEQPASPEPEPVFQETEPTPQLQTPKPKPPKSPKTPTLGKADFLTELFDPKFSSSVNTTPSLKDMKGGKVEEKYYQRLFSDLSYVEMCRLHCTTCDKHIGCGPLSISKAKRHLMLGVLVCKDCHNFYGDGNFPRDPSDNSEVYCRWCGQGGALTCCSFCPKVFCNKCVKRNYGMGYLKQIQDAEDWACFSCAAKPLWPLRAICRALLNYLENTTFVQDASKCCPVKQKRTSKTPNKDPDHQTEKRTRSSNPITTTPPKTNLIGIRQPFVVLNRARPAILQRPPVVTPARVTKPILPKPAILQRRPGRPRQLLPPPAQPHFVPVPNPPHPSQGYPIPSVVINHDYQNSLLVRIKTPRRPDSHIRVNVIGACMRVPAFPPAKKRTFVQHCLKQSFRANQMAYHHLTNILENTENRDDADNEQAVLDYLTKWKRVIVALETDVRRNTATFNAKATRSNVVVIDDDDDDVDEPVINGNINGDDENVAGLTWNWQSEASRLDFDTNEVLIIDEKPVNNNNNNNKRKTSEPNPFTKRKSLRQDNALPGTSKDPTTKTAGNTNPTETLESNDPLAEKIEEDGLDSNNSADLLPVDLISDTFNNDRRKSVDFLAQDPLETTTTNFRNDMEEAEIMNLLDRELLLGKQQNV